VDKYVIKLSRKVADYIVNNEIESEDYLSYCEENDLDDENYYFNAHISGAHVYAIAKVTLFELDQYEQRKAEGDLK
jgi:hypothetical protein